MTKILKNTWGIIFCIIGTIFFIVTYIEYTQISIASSYFGASKNSLFGWNTLYKVVWTHGAIAFLFSLIGSFFLIDIDEIKLFKNNLRDKIIWSIIGGVIALLINLLLSNTFTDTTTTTAMDSNQNVCDSTENKLESGLKELKSSVLKELKSVNKTTQNLKDEEAESQLIEKVLRDIAEGKY